MLEAALLLLARLQAVHWQCHDVLSWSLDQSEAVFMTRQPIEGSVGHVFKRSNGIYDHPATQLNSAWAE